MTVMDFFEHFQVFSRWRTQFDVLSRFFDTLWWIPISEFSALLDNFCDRPDFDAGDKVSLHD